MRRSLRLPYFIVAVVFVGIVALQILLAGLSLFWRSTVWETHVGFGHLAPLAPFVLLILALVGHLPGRLRTWSAVLFAATLVQSELFVLVREVSGAAAAYHPLLAAVILWGGIVVVQRSWALVKEPTEAPAACDPAVDQTCGATI